MRGRAVGLTAKTIPTFDAQKGRNVAPWGDNVLLLTARGARTGELLTTGTVYRRRDDGTFVIVASLGGAPQNPKWYGNLLANPEAEIEFAEGDGVKTLRVRARAVPDGPERDELYKYMTEVWPAFADYETRTDRVIPVVVLEPIE